MPLRLLLSIALIWLAGCASIADDPVRSARIALKEGQSASLSRTVTLRLDKVIDSRCPRGVLCIWAGKVDYHFTLAGKRGAEAFTFQREGDRFASSALPGLTIVLAAGEKDHPAIVDIVVPPP